MENKQVKECCKCLKDKLFTEYAKQKSSTDGMQAYCRACNNAAQREYLQRNPEAYARSLAASKLWRKNNKEANKRTVASWKENNPIRDHLISVRRNAKRVGAEFNLTIEDLIPPEFCPILGIPLIRTKGFATDGSPSVDRIIPELGYVKGNIQIISFLANKMKNSANFEQLRLFAEWVLINIPKENT